MEHQRFIDTYFSQFDGKYFTGDGEETKMAITDAVELMTYYWVSGYNLGTATV